MFKQNILGDLPGLPGHRCGTGHPAQKQQLCTGAPRGGTLDPPGNRHIPTQGMFEDSILFSQVGYCDMLVPRRVVLYFIFFLNVKSLNRETCWKILETHCKHHRWKEPSMFASWQLMD